MSKSFRAFTTVLAIVVGIAGIGVALYAWRLPPFSTTVQVTDNAYVRGQVTIVSMILFSGVSGSKSYEGSGSTADR